MLNIKSIWGDLGPLVTFTKWLNDHGIHSFSDVTVHDLDQYLCYITDFEGVTNDWKRRTLVPVMRLQTYRVVLPPQCQLPGERLWRGASAAALAEAETPWNSQNKTPRIHPDVMEPLLSAALLVTETLAPDILPAAMRLLEMRQLAHRVAPDVRRQPVRSTSLTDSTTEQLRAMLTALRATGMPLPGIRTQRRRTTVDLLGLSVGGWLNYSKLAKMPATQRLLDEFDLPVKADLFRVSEFSTVSSRPWCNHPLEATQIVALLRHVTAACLIVIVYLSGIRTGEALNLKRGCISHDKKLDLTFLSGQQLKVDESRRERSPKTIPWVVTAETANAVKILEQLTVHPLLFPAADFASEARFQRGGQRTRSPGSMNRDMSRFIDWFNQHIAPAVQHQPIPEDPQGKISIGRFRRTLAWHIVHRPGGTVAGATQYGHLFTLLIQGYAGRADAGFTDEITMEEFLSRAETIHDDHQRALGGEHISGPAADEYRSRIAIGSTFAGLTVTTRATAAKALANPALQVHHGALLTCVYRHATAACRNDDDAYSNANEPTWRRCRPTCLNAVRTDRDIANLQLHIQHLERDIAAPGLPEPLRVRINERISQHRRFVQDHEATKSVRDEQ